MKPSPVGYSRPQSVAEALQALAALGADAKVLAGGQSLVPLMSLRLAAPEHLVDINRLAELSYIRVTAGQVAVGALARHAELLASGSAQTAQPLLARALRSVAHPAIRNRGTTVGSIVHADPAAEMPAVLALLDGSVEAASARRRARHPGGRLLPRPAGVGAASRTSSPSRPGSRCWRPAAAPASPRSAGGAATTRSAAWPP